MNKTIHVVMGTSGEYSGRSEWPIAAFFDKEKAQERVKLASQWIEENVDLRNYHLPYHSPYDPNTYMDYGVEYFVYEDVPLE